MDWTPPPCQNDPPEDALGRTSLQTLAVCAFLVAMGFTCSPLCGCMCSKYIQLPGPLLVEEHTITQKTRSPGGQVRPTRRFWPDQMTELTLMWVNADTNEGSLGGLWSCVGLRHHGSGRYLVSLQTRVFDSCTAHRTAWNKEQVPGGVEQTRRRTFHARPSAAAGGCGRLQAAAAAAERSLAELGSPHAARRPAEQANNHNHKSSE